MSYLHLLIQGLGALSIVTLTHYVVAYLRSPLRNIPGPFIAKFTNLWRLWDHYNQTHIETQQELHQKYGKAVRIGPNTVSFSDPDLVKTIYSTRGTFTKVCCNVLAYIGRPKKLIYAIERLLQHQRCRSALWRSPSKHFLHSLKRLPHPAS